MWTKLMISLALCSTPSIAIAGKKAAASHKAAAKSQSNADAARKSAAKHQAKGNDASAKNITRP